MTRRAALLFAIAIVASAASLVRAATRIGVLSLSDDRQHPNLSLLDPSMSAAKAALESEGFEIASIPAITQTQLDNVDILWLPLLDAPSPGLTPTYTFSETVAVLSFLERGGRVIWFGDAGIYNTGDDSFLDTFGISKLGGNYDTSGPVVALPRHAVVTGPDGGVVNVATSATFGLMDTSSANISIENVMTDSDGPGTFLAVSTIPNTNDTNGPAGRLALVCDASIFEQFFTSDDHQALLVNLVRWLEDAPGYTPSAPASTSVAVEGLTGACTACGTTTIAFADVSSSGFTIAAPLGSGRCDVGGIPTANLPTDFVGYAISIATTAGLGVDTSATITIHYDRADLQSLGIDTTAEANLHVYEYNTASETASDVTASLDTSGQTISGTMSEPGILLFGAAVVAEDCNENGIPDDCELDGNDCNGNMILDVCEIAASTSSSGDFYCTQGCDADCNNNGVPDACDPMVTITFDTDPADGGMVQPGGTPAYDVCTTLNILATPADGYCFTGWSVDTGELPTPSDDASATIHAVSDQTITAHFTPIITQHPESLTVCEGDIANFTVILDEAYRANAEYQWRFNGMPIEGATSNQLSIPDATQANTGDYDVVVANVCDGSVTSETATLIVALPPVITSAAGSLEVCRNEDVELAVSISGTPPYNYQWTHDDVDMEGETGAILSLATVHAEDAGVYAVRVSNDCGVDIATIATIVVDEPPVVTADPTDQRACPGDDITLSFELTGVEPYAIEWIKDGNVFDETTTPTLTLEDVTSDDSGAYRARITNACGMVTSAAAQVSVDALPKILTQPTNKTACPGDSTLFQVTAVGTERTYRWRFRPTGGGAFTDVQPSVDISGQDTFRLMLDNVTDAMAGTYQCIVATDCDSVGVVSDGVTLTVNAPPQVSEHPEDVTVCAGQTATFRVGPIDASYEYQWVFNGQAISANDTAYSGQQTPELSVLNVDASLAGNYSCRLITSCPPVVFSDVATLAVSAGACDCNQNGVDDADDIAGGFSSDCNGNGIPDECDIDADSAAPGGPFYCVAGCALDCNENGVPDSCDIADGADDCNSDGIPDECQLDGHDCNADGILDSCQLADDDCNGNGILDSCEAPYVADAGPDFDLCAGRTSNALGGPVVASGSTPGYSYNWSIVAGPSGGGQVLNPTAERPQFVASVAGVYTIQLIVTDSTGCTAMDDLVATVYEMSVDAGPNITACATATNIALAGDVEGGIEPLLVQWSVEAGPSLEMTQFGGDGPNSLTPTFTPDSPGTYTLKLTATDDNERACLVSDTMTITAATMRLEGTPDFAMCGGSTSDPLAVHVASGGTAPFTYTWSIDAGPDLSPAQFGGSGIQSQTPTFSPSATGAYTLLSVVEDSSIPPCVEMREVVVNVNALDVFAGEDRTICLDTGGLLLQPTVTGGTAPLHYQWTIEPGSPSQNHLQFENQSGLHPNWGFDPQAVGAYTLKLTVTDASTPPCVATDTRVIRTTRLNLDAGPDLVTKAFEPSQALGAIPVVVGASGAVDYHWRIVAGPSLDPAQFSGETASRPTFTPAAVGKYAIEVVAEADDGCLRSDQVIVDAIISKQSMPINAEGRAFYELRLDEPYTRADVRFHSAEKGLNTSAEIMNSGVGAPFSRQVVTSIDPSDQPYVLLVAIYVSPDEMDLLSDLSALVRLNAADSVWEAAADGEMEKGLYPARPTKDDVGRQGIDTDRGIVWAVVSVAGTYTIGVPGVTREPADTGSTPSTQTTPPTDGGMCGTGAAGMAMMMVLMLATGARRRRRRYGPLQSTVWLTAAMKSAVSTADTVPSPSMSAHGQPGSVIEPLSRQ